MPDFVARRERKQLHKLPVVFVGIVLVVGVSVGVGLNRQTTGEVVSPLPKGGVPHQASSILLFFQKKKDPEVLKNLVKATVGDASDNYSVFVKEFSSDFVMGIDENMMYVAASVNKVPILAALYLATQNGDVDLDRVITMQAADVQDYGTGSMRYDPPGTTYSIKTMARLMMKQSDNTAAFIIANDILNLQDIQSLVAGWGMTQTDMFENKTSNRDMATIFEKIFSGKIANQARTEEMKSLLTDSDYENRLPAQLPEEATVYHKTGTEVGIMHDVGVVKTPKKTYYIGVMIGDATDEEQTNELIAKVSKTVYEFMR